MRLCKPYCQSDIATLFKQRIYSTGVGPELATESVLQSISAALHLNSTPVTGQSSSRASIQKNPGVNIDASQPHIQQMLVSDEDIQRQEQRVIEARRRLQDALREDIGKDK